MSKYPPPRFTSYEEYNAIATLTMGDDGFYDPNDHTINDGETKRLYCPDTMELIADEDRDSTEWWVNVSSRRKAAVKNGTLKSFHPPNHRR